MATISIRTSWELYNLDDDFSQANDVAATERQRLHDLQNLFWVEAAKYNVLPLDDRSFERSDPSLRPSLIEGRTDFTYYPGAIRIPESSAANVRTARTRSQPTSMCRKPAPTGSWWPLAA